MDYCFSKMKLKNLLKFGLFTNGNFYRKPSGLVHIVLVLHQLFILCSEAYYLDNNPYRHKKVLGPKTSFVVEWSVNWKERTIMFQVSAETKGWVGFGLSRDGRMFDSDVVIGGVGLDGKPYFDDAHIGNNRSIQIDKRQNWRLNGAWEKGKRTYLSFSRAFDTCDEQDYPITSSLVVLIWAYGETDRVQYHMKRRGSVPVYLLDPQISEELAHDHYRQIGPHSNYYLAQRWAIASTIRLPPKPSSAWCSVQRGPRLLMRHDINGLGPLLTTDIAKETVQKMLLYRCTSPQQTQAQEFFEPYAKLRGEECFLNDKRSLPLAFCRELIYVWARGGEPFYFPEDIGIPIGESEFEYFLLETHFDNPTRNSVEVEAGVEIAFSHRQKPNGASLIQVGYGPFGVFIVPPKSVMNIYGSCGPKCTARMFPKLGANAFAVMLHSHSLGRQIRLRHFRSNEELPWVINDDNYDSEFQQMRLLPRERSILPADQLITQCTFDSNDRNRTSFSGFASQDETCAAYIYFSVRIPFFRCTSEYPSDRLMQKFGVNNFTWDLTWQERYVTDPIALEGTWLSDVIDQEESSVKKPSADQLEQDLKYSPHFESCPDIKDVMGQSENQLFKMYTNDWQQSEESPISTFTPYLTSTVSFPNNVQEYREAKSCSSLPPPPPPPVPFSPHPVLDFRGNYGTSPAPVPPPPPPLPFSPHPVLDFRGNYGTSPAPSPLPSPRPSTPSIPKPVIYNGDVLLKSGLNKPSDITVPMIQTKPAEILQELTYNQPIKAFFDRLADLISPDRKEPVTGKIKLPRFPTTPPVTTRRPIKQRPFKVKDIALASHSVEPYFNEIITPNHVKNSNILSNLNSGRNPTKAIFNALHGPNKVNNFLKTAEQEGVSYQSIRMSGDILKKKG